VTTSVLGNVSPSRAGSSSAAGAWSVLRSMLLAETIEGGASTHLGSTGSRCHAGVPLELESFDGMTPGWLAAAPSGARFGSVHLPYDPAEMNADGQWPPPATAASQVVSALASSASTLVELHDLPMVKPALGQQAVGLAAFTRLRVLTLRETYRMAALHATLLPASLEDLTLQLNLPNMDFSVGMGPPLFADFARLRHLRCITLVEFANWRLGSPGGGQGWWLPALLPRSLEVRAP